MIKNKSIIVTLALATSLLAGSLFAQEKAPANKPDAWVAACREQNEQTICDAVQTLVDSKSGNAVVVFAVAKLKATNSYGLMVRIPLGFRLDSGLGVMIDGKLATGLEKVNFTRCMPEGCYAETPLTADNIKAIKAGNALGIAFLDLSGKPAIINLEKADLNKKLDSALFNSK